MTDGLELPLNREKFVREHVWWVGVCAEADGDECGTGTNLLALSHKCEAFGRWRDYMQADDRAGRLLTEAEAQEVARLGPRCVWVPVTFDGDVLKRA